MAWISWSQTHKENDDNEQETSEMQFEGYALKTNVLAFASRSKAKTKPRRRTLACSSRRTAPIGERKWTDIEPEEYSPIAYPLAKSKNTLLRHGDIYFEKKMETTRILETERMIFGTILCTLNIGLMKCGRVHWQEAEETRKYFSIVLILQDKQFFTSELSMVIQDAISLILHYRTMSWLRTISSMYIYHVGCADQLYIPSSIQDWYREVKIWAKDRQYSSLPVNPMDKEYKDPGVRSTWKHRVLHGTCIQHGWNIKTRCIGSTSNLLKRTD